ncbi:MAG: hypothetical protein ACLRWP_13505 [Bilophila wadsworthia]
MPCRLATQVMLGKTLRNWTLVHAPFGYVSVKESVFPFRRFPAWTSCSDLKCVPPRSHGHRPDL